MDILNLQKQDAVISLEVVEKNVAIGIKGGIVTRVRRIAIKINIDFSKDLTFLDDMADDFVVTIGDTFYRKGGACFKYDYGNTSSDYRENLEGMAEDGDVYIIQNIDLERQGC